MKRILQKISIAFLSVFAVLVMSIVPAGTAKAEEESPQYEYYVKFTKYNLSNRIEQTFTLNVNCRLAFLKNGYTHSEYDATGKRADNIPNYYLFSQGDRGYLSATNYMKVWDRQNGKYKTENTSIETVTTFLYPKDLATFNPDIYQFGNFDFETNIPIFTDTIAMAQYMDTGIAPLPIDSPHDFSADIYSKDIPVPEINSISHNGFSVANNPDGKYYIDIFQKTILYGVKVKNVGVMSYYPTVNEGWLFSSHIYNYVDSKQPTNFTNISISEIYGINPEDDLINDFKNWSAQYPSFSSLPTYSWYMGGSGPTTSYRMTHCFSTSSDKTDLEQLQVSQQAESTYFVRFHDADGNYGQWVKYSFRDGARIEGGFVRIEMPKYDEEGKLSIDDDGGVIIEDSLTGRQDYDTGIMDYGDINAIDKWWDVPGDVINDSSFLQLIGGAKNVFEFVGNVFTGLASSVKSFSSLVSACFSFLPGQLLSLIVSGITIIIFIGIIKAVIK